MTATADFSAYFDRLRALPFIRDVRLRRAPQAGRKGRSFDAAIDIVTRQGVTTAYCELKRAHLGSEVAERLVQVAREEPHLLLFAPAVGREIGDLFEREGVNFVDLAGNCYLRIGHQYVARIQGRRSEPVAISEKGLRAPAYRVLFAFLGEPRILGKPTRVIAAAAGGVSPQTVSTLRLRLVEQGVVLRTHRLYCWSPGGWRRALDLWLAGFTTTLLPSLTLGRYRARERTVEALEARLGADLNAVGAWRWGGGAAARRLTGYYRGDRTLVYLRDRHGDLAKRLSLVRDASGPIAIVQAPGPLAFESPEPETVHPLLAYTDLLAEGHDRAREAAGELYARHLAAFEREA